MSRDYPSEISATAKAIGDDAVREIAAGRQAFATSLQHLVNVNVFLRYLVDRGIPAGAPRGIRTLYAKMADLTSGVCILLAEGYPGPSASVFRSLLETAVHLQLILAEDIEARAKLFEDFILLQRGKVTADSGVSTEAIAENAAALSLVRENYHPEQPYSWCWKLVPSRYSRRGIPNNPSLREVCVAIGKPHYYDDLYGHLSDAVHPTPAYELWMRGRESELQLNPKFSSHTRMTAHLSTLLVIDSVLPLLQAFPPDDYDALCSFIGTLLPAEG
jgi:hypothetical protein